MTRSFTEELEDDRRTMAAINAELHAHPELVQELMALLRYLERCTRFRDAVAFTTVDGRPDHERALRLQERLERNCRVGPLGLWVERRGHQVQFGIDLGQCLASPDRPRPAFYWRYGG